MVAKGGAFARSTIMRLDQTNKAYGGRAWRGERLRCRPRPLSTPPRGRRTTGSSTTGCGAILSGQLPSRTRLPSPLMLAAELDDAVWIEDPIYMATRGALSGAGARLVPVPVEEEGPGQTTARRCAAPRTSAWRPAGLALRKHARGTRGAHARLRGGRRGGDARWSAAAREGPGVGFEHQASGRVKWWARKSATRNATISHSGASPSAKASPQDQGADG
jgi:hypothetical protein